MPRRILFLGITSNYIGPYVELRFSKAKTLSHSQDLPGSQLLLDVAAGKADVTFLEKVYAEEYLSKNPGTIKALSNAKPLRFFR